MRHLLSTADLSRDEITSLLNVAEEMHEVQRRPIKKIPALRGRTIVNIFFEDSTRTRSSFEIAGKWMSADTINVSAKGSSVSKGESLRDTMMTLDAMGVDCFVIRHNSSGAVAQAAGWVRAHVVNAGDGQHEHPTQALLDAYTMRRHFREAKLADTFRGKRIAIVGDLLDMHQTSLNGRDPGIGDPFDVAIAHLAFEQALSVADAVEPQVADIGL